MSDYKIFPEYNFWETENKLFFQTQMRKKHEDVYYRLGISKVFKIEETITPDKIAECTNSFLVEVYRCMLFNKIDPVKIEEELERRKLKDSTGFSVMWKLDENQESEEDRINKIK